MNHAAPSPATDSPADLASDATLDHLALFAVRGADALSFLDSQLTRNVTMPDAGETLSRASLAGYCSPKGRLLASLLVWSDVETIFLITSRDVADAVAKRLRMYVLRAKVTVEDVTPTHAIEAFSEPSSIPSGAGSLDAWSTFRESDATWIRHPDADGMARWMRIGTSASASTGGSLDRATWRWSEIRAGIPRITAATQDRFVPQMVNLEALGGVDFKKGCFPGQEVVARSQYLGKLKRRMTLASIEGAADLPAPAADVWTTGESGPNGLVVNAEYGPDGRISALVELPVALFASRALTVGEGGPALTLETLPYALPDNDVFVRPKL